VLGSDDLGRQDEERSTAIHRSIHHEFSASAVAEATLTPFRRTAAGLTMANQS
jgi:hypothetical protein